MPQSRIEIDEDEFIRDYLSGRLAVGELAAKHGISTSLVYKILAGDRRPEVASRIEDAIRAARWQATRHLIALQQRAIAALDRAMAQEGSAFAVAAAREVLRRTLPNEAPPLRPNRTM